MNLMILSALLGWSKATVAMPAAVLWLFLSITIGLCTVSAISETVFFITHDDFWKRSAQFWMRFVAICLPATLLLAIMTGGALAWNWVGLWQSAPEWWAMPMLIWEGATVILELFFLLMAVKGWKALSASTHLMMTWLTGLGLLLALWAPIALNAWMESPICNVIYNSGVTRFSLQDCWWMVLFAPLTVAKILHIFFAGNVIGAALTVAVSVKAINKGLFRFGKTGIGVGLLVGFIGLILTMCMGDNAGIHVAKDQHMKMAAIQNLQDGGRKMPYTVAGSFRIPTMLSRLATRNNRGYVPGINNILNGGYAYFPTWPVDKDPQEVYSFEAMKKKANQYRYTIDHNQQYKWKRNDPFKQRAVDRDKTNSMLHVGYSAVRSRAEMIPNVPLLFWTFRIMVSLGLLLFAVMGLLIFWECTNTQSERRHDWVLRLAHLFLPLALLSSLCGWAVSEAGRAPWTIQNLLSAPYAVSQLPKSQVVMEFGILAALSLAILLLAVWAMLRIARKGPEQETEKARKHEAIRPAVEE